MAAHNIVVRAALARPVAQRAAACSSPRAACRYLGTPRGGCRHMAQLRCADAWVPRSASIYCAADTAEAPGVAAPEQPSPSATTNDSGAFDWFQQWYPLMPLRMLEERSGPRALKLLGQDLVLWRDEASGQWCAAVDRCPHRLARMSDGRMINGKLTCSYHGWQFDGRGKCTLVPQTEGGLLWVWASPDPATHAAAAAAPLPVVPENGDADWFLGGGEHDNLWGYLVMPCEFALASENPFDPSHAPYLHDRTLRMRREDAIPMNMSLPGDVTPRGFLVRHRGYLKSNREMKATRQLIAPGTARIEYHYPNGQNWLALPDFFRHLDDAPDEDRAILHGQGQVVAAQARGGAAAPRYFLPTPSDAGVAAWRVWLRDHGGGGVPYAGGTTQQPPRAWSRQEMLDRHALHAETCKACQEGLALCRAGAAAATAALAAAVLAAATRAAQAQARAAPLPVPFLASAGAAALVAWVLRTGFLQLRQHIMGYQEMPWERRAVQGPLATLPESTVKALVVLARVPGAALRLLRARPAAAA
ncbi:Rieske (2Fe-2S) domain [Micractinium conductrix]|uniref:Rieske (2Fe-2S) domain n=1 Tax=Micractinium conductrix TaxID=554055 RepID=A0A2P6VHE2_9CHLO|nr:Rieske (2Fe-2S) domain [Micractinium conductrix]|eukprot:PSC73513.1 Rieske (2Fe-2S) domain [Micractinium conductrix]